jgi:hypothetical protein
MICRKCHSATKAEEPSKKDFVLINIWKQLLQEAKSNSVLPIERIYWRGILLNGSEYEINRNSVPGWIMVIIWFQ